MVSRRGKEACDHFPDQIGRIFGWQPIIHMITAKTDTLFVPRLNLLRIFLEAAIGLRNIHLRSHRRHGEMAEDPARYITVTRHLYGTGSRGGAENPDCSILRANNRIHCELHPRHAVRFDLEGRPVETLAHAYRPGEVTLYIGGRKIPPETLGRILNTSPSRT
jgi:hypothetical protein